MSEANTAGSATGEHSFEVTFRDPGVEVYVFTFGSMARTDELVVVEVAGTGPEAELLCSLLRNAGIDCVPRLTNRGAGAGDGLGTVGPHEIMVRPQDAQAAREILHQGHA